jgi:hypothetical protein
MKRFPREAHLASGVNIRCKRNFVKGLAELSFLWRDPVEGVCFDLRCFGKAAKILS